jgi:peptidyl-prolyl cis-trans isomerase SurA
MRLSLSAWIVALFALAACNAPKAPPPAPPAVSAAPAPTPPAAPPTAPAPPAADEACAQVLVVAWQGAERAPATITRDESTARARAESLRTRVEAGEDLTALARAESDAPTSAARGGLLGTFARSEWPPLHDGLKNPVFALPVGGLSELVRMPYGYVLARRCPVEKVHTRHILVRFAGAKNAGPEVRRTRDEAARRAAEIRNTLLDGADFAQVARTMSEDASAERGGDLGSVGRGRLAPEYERVAFTLPPGQPSPVIETEFGFHIVERLP